MEGLGSKASGWRLACWTFSRTWRIVVLLSLSFCCRLSCSHRTSFPAVLLCWRTRKVRVRKLRTASQASREPMTLPRCTRCAFKPVIQSVPVPLSVPMPLLSSVRGICRWSSDRQANTPHNRSPWPPKYLVPL